jgi:glycosyltransferase involved in cell wall biosynthesis
MYTAHPSDSERLPVAVLLSGREKFGAYYGGALARWTYEVYRHLTSEVDVTVFGFPTSGSDRYPLRHETNRTWRLCVLMGHVPLVRRYEERAWLRALMGRLLTFAVVHIHNRPQWAAMLRQLGYRGAIVLHLQNDHLGHWSGPMLDALTPHLDAVVVCSEYLRNTFIPRSSLLASKTHVVFNGVNTDLFFPKEELREPKTIFFVGRFDPQKGVLPLVHAYAGVLKDHPDARLVIGGTTGFGTHDETAYVREVREAAESIVAKQHGNIQFTGYIHHDRDLPHWFQRATIFAGPSVFQEPFGLVNAEAMACGTVVVGSRRGGIPEVLGETGRLIDPENIGEFTEAMSSLLADTRRRSELAAAALERTRRILAWPVIAKRWADLLRSLRNSSRAA